jgi:hypothetical protein
MRPNQLALARRRLPAFLALVFCGAAGAQAAPELPGWHHITDSERFAFYVRDVQRTDDQLTLWVKNVASQAPEDCNRYPFMSPSRQECGQRREQDLHSSVERWEVDCRARRYRVLGGASYNRDGKSLGSTSAPEPWALLIPDSVAEGVAGPLCDAKPWPDSPPAAKGKRR